MTVRQMIAAALTALGYVDSLGNPAHASYSGQALAAANSIYAELYYCLYDSGFVPLQSYDDGIDLPERLLYDCMHYGVAMLLAQSENDGDSQRIFAELYNAKLGAANSHTSVLDLLPEVGEI